MGLFRRRRETLNEQLLREAGLDPAEVLGDSPPPGPLMPPPSALALVGSRIEFTTIPNGDVIVSEEAGDTDLSPLADAVEERLSPPYRAVAQRQGDDLWAVAAQRIEVMQIPFPDGDKLELSRHRDRGELRVDGEPSDALVPPELERLGEDAGDGYYAEAERIDGDLWEVRVTAL